MACDYAASPLLQPEVLQTASGWAPTLTYEIVTTLDALHRMRDTLVNVQSLAYDTEGSGLKTNLGARIIGHALAAVLKENVITAYYVPVRHVGPANENAEQLTPEVVAPIIQEILGRVEGEALFHHAKFDMQMARADGIIVKRKPWDVAILATAYNENEPSFALKKLGVRYCMPSAKDEKDQLDEWMKKEARGLKICFKKRGKKSPDEKTYLEQFGYSRTPIDMCGRYACRDVFFTLYLYWVQYRHVRDQFPDVVDREHALIPIIHDMEWYGLPANVEEIDRADKLTRAGLERWMNICRELTGDPDFSLSPEYLRELFFEKMQLTPPKETRAGALSVDKEARLLLRHTYPQWRDLFDAIGKAGKLEKTRSTYTGSFRLHYSKTTGCIHGTYNQIERKAEGGVPVTGRLSSAEPNVQNIETKPIHLPDCECKACVKEYALTCEPSEERSVSVRRYFTVPGGYVRAFLDFSQIELRVLAWFSRDPSLLECYANDMDVHQMTADSVTGGDRKLAKTVNFANIYGQMAHGLAKKMAGYYEDPEGTELKAEQVLAAYFRKYWGIPRFRDTFAAKMRANGNAFVNPFGRPRRIPEISADQHWIRRAAERRMMSSIISGTAADVMKISMLRCDDLLKVESPKSRMVQTIHDELIFDLYAADGGWARTLVGLVRVMESWPMFESQGVPIRVGVKVSNTNWEELKGVEINAAGELRFAA